MLAKGRTKFTKRVLNECCRSMPLIIPNDTNYDVCTNELKSIPNKRRTSLKLVPETVRVLESIQRPLAVLAIGGPCRTGKSYILSRVLGSADDFALGHTMNAKTFGIWIGTTVLDCDKFTVLLMDTEGIDSTNAQARDDASILVMTVLLSSHFIYNSIGVPKKNDLQKMSHFAKLATSIAVKDVADPDAYDLKSHFPDFLWLLRDAVLKVPPGCDGKPMTPTDYLKTEVLNRSRGFKETEEDRIGRAILTVFPTVECTTIQPPSANPEVMQDIVAKQDCLEPRFNEQVEDLIEYLLQRVKAKNGFEGGKLVDGPLLAAIANKFLKAVNDPDAIPCITDTWQAAVEARCRKVLDQIVQEYTKEMEAKIVSMGLPMEEDSMDDKDLSEPCTLLGLHRSILTQKIDKLMKEVGHFVSGRAANIDGSVSVLSTDTLCTTLERTLATFEDTTVSIRGKRVSLKKVTGGKLHKFAQRNFTESSSYCLAVFVDLYWKLEDKMQNMSSYTFEELTKDLTALHEAYCQRAIGPAKWEVYVEKESFIKSQAENYQRLCGFQKEAFDALQKAAEEKARNDQLNESLNELQFQMKNDAELNKKKIEKLQEEHKKEMTALRQQHELRSEQDRKKYEDLMQAKMVEMAQHSEKSRIEVEEKYTKLMKSMNDMHTQRENSFKAQLSSVNGELRQVNSQLQEVCAERRRGSCFVAGTAVQLSNGLELPIEKQRKGIKLLALGGETTTITDEFVEHVLDAGQKLVGFNDDTPFVALHHPFWTTEGWKCLDPETAREENPNIDFKLLQVGDIIFRIAQTEPLLYEPVKVQTFTFLMLQEPTKIYGLHLDGPRSYHANGYAVMANYPVLTKRRIQEGMKKLSEKEKESLTSALSSVKVELTKVLGSWANEALDDMGLTASAIED